MEITEKQVLIGGREKVANAWCQRQGRLNLANGQTAYCASEAIRETAYQLCVLTYSEKELDECYDLTQYARERIAAIVSPLTSGYFDLADWNDNRDRTQEEVIAAFDAAIASFSEVTP